VQERRYRAHAALLLFGVATGLGFTELMLRTCGSPTDAGDLRGLHEARPDRSWLYGLRPGANLVIRDPREVRYRINQDGFRDRRFARPKPPRTFRVVVLGDSISFGYGVEEAEAFPRLIGERLSGQAGDERIEVLNLGVGGYNPYNELELLRDVGRSYEPDLVLVQFCINDLNDPTLHFDRQTRMHLGNIPAAAFPDPTVRRAEEQVPPFVLRLCRVSVLCSRLDDLWLALTERSPREEDQRAAVVPIGGADRPEWSWLEQHYAEMASMAAGMGARFAVIAFPYPQQLHAAGPDPVQERLRTIGRRGRWLTLDPLPVFRQAARDHPGRALFLDWWHPTAEGHRLAADQIVSQLACAELLPALTVDLCLGAPHAAAGGE